MKAYAYRIEAILPNGLEFELYGRLTYAGAKRITDKLYATLARGSIMDFFIGQGPYLPPQRIVLEFSEEGLDAEIDRQILMMKAVPPL